MKITHPQIVHTLDKDTLVLLKPNDIQLSVAEWTPNAVYLHRDTDMLH